jgi:hypothetical protein
MPALFERVSDAASSEADASQQSARADAARLRLAGRSDGGRDAAVVCWLRDR